MKSALNSGLEVMSQPTAEISETYAGSPTEFRQKIRKRLPSNPVIM